MEGQEDPLVGQDHDETQLTSLQSTFSPGGITILNPPCLLSESKKEEALRIVPGREEPQINHLRPLQLDALLLQLCQ